MAELHIAMGGRPVGVLDGKDRRNLRITYDDTWVDHPTATPLSVSMPLAAKTHSGKTVAPYLWGLLPDNDRVLARWAADYQCSASDVFAFLEHVGADVAGAAQYLPAGNPVEEATDGRIDPLTEDDVAALLREVRADTTAWHPQARGRWSLAGAQGKLALAYDDQTGTWGMPSGSAATTHILKPAIAALDHHDLNEHLCLATAGRLGLRVAETAVQRFVGEPALVVSRYDRVRLEGGRIVRVHQEDCCQALGIHPARKYESEGGPSIEDIAALLRGVVLTDADRDIDALVRAAAYNWLILGTDAHAKNYSVLLSGHQVRLAPLYDIASAAPYGDHPRKLRMAQKIGGEYRPTVVAGRHWDRLATTVRIAPERLRADIAEMIDRLPDALDATIRSTDLADTEVAVARNLLDAVAGWVARCRSAMDE